MPSADLHYVIGPGEVGRRLGRAIEKAGHPVRYVARDDGDGWQAALAARGTPRILSMREDDLPAALARFEEVDHEDLVLVQNGFLEAVLGSLPEVTRGLIWFTSKGDFFRILRPSPFHGPCAADLSEALAAGGLDAEPIGDVESFLREMILKGLWNCVVGLPLAVHGVDLEGYLAEYPAELETLCGEGAAAASLGYGIEVTGEAAAARLRETTGELGWVTGGAKALDWRNGAVAAFGRREGVPTPTHDRLLAAVGYDPKTHPLLRELPGA